MTRRWKTTWAMLLVCITAWAQTETTQQVKNIQIDRGDRHIKGILMTPEHTTEKQPVVIISHGFNGTHHVGHAYQRTLLDMGCQVLAFDYPCVSLKSSSDNNTMNMSIKDQIADLRTVMKYAKKLPHADAKRIILIGESQGGFVSALTTAEVGKEVSALVLVFPALCIPNDWNKRYPSLEAIPDTTYLWRVPIGKRFFKELRHINAFDKMKNYKKPVLIIQGDKDRVVSIEDAQRATLLYPHAQLHIIKGAGHGFKAKEQEEAQRVLKKFMQDSVLTR